MLNNLESKTFEVLDRMTFIPVVATRVASIDPRDCVLLAWAGFRDPDTILLCHLSSGRATYDPYAWGDRTLKTAHLHIQKHWHDLRSGDVVDVEFVLGETGSPKESECPL